MFRIVSADNFQGILSRNRYRIDRIERPAPLRRFNRLSSAIRHLSSLSRLKLTAYTIRSRIIASLNDNTNSKSSRFKGLVIVYVLSPSMFYPRLSLIPCLTTKQFHSFLSRIPLLSCLCGHTIVCVLFSPQQPLRHFRLKNTTYHLVFKSSTTFFDPPHRELTPLPPSTFKLPTPLCSDSSSPSIASVQQ